MKYLNAVVVILSLFLHHWSVCLHLTLYNLNYFHFRCLCAYFTAAWRSREKLRELGRAEGGKKPTIHRERHTSTTVQFVLVFILFPAHTNKPRSPTNHKTPNVGVNDASRTTLQFYFILVVFTVSYRTFCCLDSWSISLFSGLQVLLLLLLHAAQIATQKNAAFVNCWKYLNQRKKTHNFHQEIDQ